MNLNCVRGHEQVNLIMEFHLQNKKTKTVVFLLN